MKPVDPVTPTLPGNTLRRVEDRRKPGDRPRRDRDRQPEGTPPGTPPEEPGATTERRHIIDELA
jgi:hypothetical protein